MDENTLLQASKNGDVEAFNLLVLEYQGQIYNVCYRILGDPSAAEDMTQEAFVSAYKNIGRFKEGNFRAWLYRIASNACRDYLRSPRIRKNQSLEVIEETSEYVLTSNLESPDSFAIRKEPVSYTHLRAHETVLDLVCRLLRLQPLHLSLIHI